MARARGREQRVAALRRRVGADFVDRDLLQRQGRRERFQELPRGLRVLDDEMRETSRHRDRSRRQHVLRRNEAKQVRDEESRPAWDRRLARQARGGSGNAGLAQQGRRAGSAEGRQGPSGSSLSIALEEHDAEPLRLDGTGAIVGLFAPRGTLRCRQSLSARNVLTTSTSAVRQRRVALSSSARPV